MGKAKCTCPVIEIICARDGQVSDAQMRAIANDLRAQVSLKVENKGRSTLWGTHRLDCPVMKRKSKSQ